MASGRSYSNARLSPNLRAMGAAIRSAGQPGMAPETAKSVAIPERRFPTPWSINDPDTRWPGLLHRPSPMPISRTSRADARRLTCSPATRRGAQRGPERRIVTEPLAAIAGAHIDDVAEEHRSAYPV